MIQVDNATSQSLALSERSFTKFAQFITSELGIKMPAGKISMLQSRLLRRLKHLGIASLEEYQEYLFTSPCAEQERVHFIDAVTTNKTDFFRESEHFTYLMRHALPELDPDIRNGRGEQRRWPFKLWCAGCSTGEEPYTQAMVLSEFGEVRRGFEFKILATDVSTRVLEHAELGIYDEARVAVVPDSYRKKYLLKSKSTDHGQVRITPELRSKVYFNRLNFMDADYKVRDMFDVVFHRNVLIYFDKPTQEAVINKLCKNLKPGGYLFVGHSESLSGLKVPLVSVSTAVFRKVK
jgi:chemotaxis protein methyltransferase CheR